MTVEPGSLDLALALDGLEPADADSEDNESNLWAGDLDVMATHLSGPYGSHSYIVAHDRSATWGLPGAPQILAIAVARDFALGTFTLEQAFHASVPFAQAWLVERGCPPERTAVPAGTFIEPADDLTRRTEQKIREAGQRYQVLDTHTRDYDPYESWTLARDTLALQEPIRVFLERDNPKTFTYTVREGAFADEDAANAWLEDRDGPLPPEPAEQADATSARARAALARSTSPTGPRAVCGLDTLPQPTPPAAQRPGPGRSL
ncbi:glycosyl hydrolase [Streptomyces sp. CA-111067]|uniref:glycosyl hydrolase n=1 Tax=Streptomyces sp. CA-111067 TaxID=3240046 RepID=UPI003D95A6A9